MTKAIKWLSSIIEWLESRKKTAYKPKNLRDTIKPYQMKPVKIEGREIRKSTTIRTPNGKVRARKNDFHIKIDKANFVVDPQTFWALCEDVYEPKAHRLDQAIRWKIHFTNLVQEIDAEKELFSVGEDHETKSRKTFEVVS